VLAAVMPLSLGAAQAAPIVYEAPAEKLQAGRLGVNPFWAVLPSGRLVKPDGSSVAAGTDAQGLALSPDGRYAFVAGSDLTVIDVGTMRVVARYANLAVGSFTGVVTARDPADASRSLVIAAAPAANAVYFFGFDGRELAPDGRAPSLPVAGFPEKLVLASDGKTLYAIDGLGDNVTAIDLQKRSVRARNPVGYAPLGAALAGDRLLVCNEGLMRYLPLAHPMPAPVFRTPAADMAHASSLSVLGLDADGGFVAGDAGAGVDLWMDRPPDGIRIIGGAHPSAVAATPDGAYAFVAMANVDRVAVVALDPTPRVVTGIDLRLFPLGPFGTQPDALELSRDGKRLYVALAGLNAIAVLDASQPLHLRRLGLIPTGDYPTALALSDDGRRLFVVNAKGAGPQGDAVPSTFQRVELAGLDLVHDTYTVLGATRVAHPASAAGPVVPPLGAGRGSGKIKHVVAILLEDKTFDSVLGDLVDVEGRPHGDGDPAMAVFGARLTPNLHALARTYALADNFYSDARSMVLGHEFALGGVASDYSMRRVFAGAAPTEDPEDYARFGFIFNTLALHRMGYRDYGDLLFLRGYDDGMYSMDVPALAVLRGHVDERYPGWNPAIPDRRRALEFIRDYGALAARGKAPRYCVVWLPGKAAADGDAALGIIVSHLTRTPVWKDTAIFILPADSATQRDHVSSQRSFAIIVSPYARRGYVGHRHLSTVSALKTEEELLGLPPLSLGDLLATDMSDFFTSRPNFAPYTSKAVPAAGRGE
jgi:DNA-binding beta-propeller fold protein YncE